jgi:hypothetical protein
MALMTVSAIALTEKPLVRKVQEKRWGLLPRRRLPSLVETALAVPLLDYTLYIWHVLTHKVPLLWRLHRVSLGSGPERKHGAAHALRGPAPSWRLGGFGPKPDRQEPSPARGSRLTA